MITEYDKYLAYLVFKGAMERYGHSMTDAEFDKQDVIESYSTPEIELHRRIRRELTTIGKAGFPGYFLIVADLMRYCRRSGIPVGPGRGSVCGSVVAYCLYITDIDPLKFDIPFERFLHLDRVAMPDIDLDICQVRRGEAIDYLRDVYGHDNVTQIITFGTMQARGVIKDIFRIMHVDDVILGKRSNTLGEKLSAMIPEGSGADQVKISEFIDTEEGINFKTEFERVDRLYCAKKKLPAGYLMGQVLVLEGIRRHGSVHAAGVVIGDSPLVDAGFPVYRRNQGAELQIQYDMRDAEDVGLLKLDVLGLRTVSVLGEAEHLIQRVDPDFKIKDVPLDDDATFTLLRGGDTKGVFQLEGDQITAALTGLRPDTFEDIIALLALFRPGPIEQLGSYIARKHGEEKVHYAHPDLEPVLSKTYGLIVYQEQVMGIARVLGGYSPGEADMFRKAIGKKLPELIAEQIGIFTERAIARGCDKDVIQHIGEQIAYFGRYGFNRGHATGYGFITYWTAYLKANFPYEFYTAILNSYVGKTDRIALFVRDASHHGIQVRCPDINRSGSEFTCVRGESIRFGMSAIKGVGDAYVLDILEERDGEEKNEHRRVQVDRVKPDGTKYKAYIKKTVRVTSTPTKFESFIDFCIRLPGVPINVKKVLIEAGAFDSGDIRERAAIHALAESVNKEAKKKNPKEPPLPDFIPGELEMLKREREALGFYVTRHPLDIYRDDLDMYGACIEGEFDDLPRDLIVAGIVVEVKLHVAKNGEMAWVTLETGINGLPDITIFNSIWQKVQVKSDDVIIVRGQRTDHPKFGVGFRADSVTVFDKKVANIDSILITMPDPDLEGLIGLRDVLDKTGARVYLAAPVVSERLALIKTASYIVPTGGTLKALRNQGYRVRLGFQLSDDIAFGSGVCRKADSMYKGSGASRRALWELPMAKLMAKLLGGKVVAEYHMP